jgi:hypothetical protein
MGSVLITVLSQYINTNPASRTSPELDLVNIFVNGLLIIGNNFTDNHQALILIGGRLTENMYGLAFP